MDDGQLPKKSVRFGQRRLVGRPSMDDLQLLPQEPVAGRRFRAHYSEVQITLIVVSASD